MPRYIKKKYCLKFGKKKPPDRWFGSSGTHLVHKDVRFLGILSRDFNYRFNARKWMGKTGYYDDESQIREGVSKEYSVRDSNKKKLIEEFITKEKISDVNTGLEEEELRELLIKARIPKYKFKSSAPGKDGRVGILNFTGGSKPYPNEAHHILSCDVFYHGDWTPELLMIVKECGYNINNEGNILYMPIQSGPNKYGEYDKCFFHGFPNHYKQHDKYNKEVCNRTRSLIEKADEAKCGPDKKKRLKELFDMLINIEKDFYKHLIERKPGLPMW